MEERYGILEARFVLIRGSTLRSNVLVGVKNFWYMGRKGRGVHVV